MTLQEALIQNANELLLVVKEHKRLLYLTADEGNFRSVDVLQCSLFAFPTQNV